MRMCFSAALAGSVRLTVGPDAGPMAPVRLQAHSRGLANPLRLPLSYGGQARKPAVADSSYGALPCDRIQGFTWRCRAFDLMERPGGAKPR